VKRLIASLSVLLVLGAMVAPASARATRAASFDYNVAAQVGTAEYGAWIGATCIGENCVRGMSNLKTDRTERAVSVKIADATGASVKGFIIQDGIEKEFCGSSGRVRMEGGEPIAIYVSANPCAEVPDGVVTTGTVTAKFFD
jgi:hypothetical protein